MAVAHKLEKHDKHNIKSLYKQLRSDWESSQRNLNKCGEILSQLKIALKDLMFYPSANTKKEELKIGRDILEIGVQWSIEVNCIQSFERNMCQLKPYYFDYDKQISESELKYELLGLNLLFLLSQNRIAEFHTELELLPAERLLSDIYIRHVLSLEQYIMEGNYNKIFSGKGTVPTQNYNFFMDILLETMRGEIALCLERAYEKISINDAARKLFLPNVKAVRDYVKTRNWKLGQDKYFYFVADGKNQEEPIPAIELAENSLYYARELTMIV